MDDENARKRFLRALQGPKPFRRFSEALVDFPRVREAWFAWHAARMRERVLEWLEEQEPSTR